MNVPVSTVAAFAALAMGWWMKKDSGFKVREFSASVLFALIVLTTPWGQQINEGFKTGFFAFVGAIWSMITSITS